MSAPEGVSRPSDKLRVTDPAAWYIQQQAWTAEQWRLIRERWAAVERLFNGIAALCMLAAVTLVLPMATVGMPTTTGRAIDVLLMTIPPLIGSSCIGWAIWTSQRRSNN